MPVAFIVKRSVWYLTATLQGHMGDVDRAMFLPDGQRILTTSQDGTARVWQIITLNDIAKILSQ
jgi:WD40 repeat protein